MRYNSNTTISNTLLICVFILSYIFSSCEEIIEIDLNSSIPVIVAEGQIERDSAGWIKLSYSTDYYTKQEPEYIDNASVVLTDNKGNLDIFTYKGNGLYKGATITGKENSKYTLRITAPNFTYAASSFLHEATVISSVSFEKAESFYHDNTSDEYTAKLKFRDDPTRVNYYMIKLLKSGLAEENRYMIFKDNYPGGGDTYELSIQKRVEKGDEVIIRLYSIDKDTYIYYSQLNDLIDSGIRGTSTPYNPKSNFGPPVMGYFRAFSYVSVSAVVE